jgi:2-polyprenyl-3-methyl-5-hydroxy-6-metoxy-1,4-benzoquinol methylase
MHVKSATYYDNINVPLLDAIPASAATVLEIGCGQGALGAAFKTRQPECRYLGVEIHPLSAEIAATRLDQVWCGAVEQVDLQALAGRVDCLVYGDVLEHLVDPWGVLKAHRLLLADGGSVVASIPNVQNWALLHHLLQGHWTYMDHGILDDTHLRFFTLNSIVALFAQADLQIRSAVGLIPNQPGATDFFDRIKPVLGALGVDEDRFRLTIAPLQYLIQADRA